MVSLQNCDLRVQIRGGTPGLSPEVFHLDRAAQTRRRFGCAQGNSSSFWPKMGLMPSVKVDMWGLVRLQYRLVY